MRTRVVNLRLEAYDVYIGRKGRGHDGYWGNPFRPGPGESAGATIPRFRVYFLERIERDPEFRSRALALRGKRLGCFCKDADGFGPCHGDVIVEWVEAQVERGPWGCECGWVGRAQELVAKVKQGKPKIGCPLCLGGVRLRYRMLRKIETTQRTTASNEAYSCWLSYREQRDLCEAATYVFTDGATSGSYAALVRAEADCREYVVHGPQVTIANVGAELMAVALGLYHAPAGAKLVLVSDFLGTAPWLNGHFKVSCPEVMKRLRLIRRIAAERAFQRIDFVHHKGHQRDASAFTTWNNRCDLLCARRPKRLSQQGAVA